LTLPVGTGSPFEKVTQMNGMQTLWTFQASGTDDYAPMC
jgi:hypothetical protein